MRLTWLLVLVLLPITRTLNMKIQHKINAWQILTNQNRVSLRQPKLNRVLLLLLLFLLDLLYYYSLSYMSQRFF